MLLFSFKQRNNARRVRLAAGGHDDFADKMSCGRHMHIVAIVLALAVIANRGLRVGGRGGAVGSPFLFGKLAYANHLTRFVARQLDLLVQHRLQHFFIAANFVAARLKLPDPVEQRHNLDDGFAEPRLFLSGRQEKLRPLFVDSRQEQAN